MIKTRIILASLVLLIAVGLTFALPGLTTTSQFQSGQNHSPFHGVYTALAAGSVSSVKSGAWSDPSVWNSGGVPGTGDSVTINSGHTVTYGVADSKIAGMTIEVSAKLAFTPNKTTILRTNKNIVVFGTLQMKPSSPFVHQTIRFEDIDETKFVGGGMAVFDTDVGLWIRDQGLLDIAGSPKTAWTRLAGGANAGDTIIQLQSAPSGWQVGDQISVVPTEHPSVGNASWDGFDLRTITAISGSVVTVNALLSRNHPAATDPNTGKSYTAEVLNLSRNVHIEGTGDGSAGPANNGRAHIQFHVTVPQFVSYAEFKLLGPRQYTGQSNYTAGVLGRYAFHFHHGGDGTRGSVIEGTVVTEAGFHAYVPHASHGITFRDTISYNTFDDAYWWDPPVTGDPTNETNNSEDILYDRAVAALSKPDITFRGLRNSGFNLMAGRNNEVRDSVAVGIQGGNVAHSDSSGFQWPEFPIQQPGVWIFNQGNISHNNKVNGIFTWQNTSGNHIVENAVLYHNGYSAVDHGAYGNRYQYINITAFGNGSYGLQSHASARSETDARTDGYSLVFEDLRATAPLLFPRHNVAGALRTLFKNCIFTEVVVNDNTGNNHFPTRADFVNCTKPNGQSLEPGDFTLQNVVPGLDIRVQRPNNTAYQLGDGGGVRTISAFYQGGTNQPLNQPPSVDAGPVLTIGLGGAATLNGTVSDDGLPNPPGVITTRWTKVSGPGSVTFGNANTVDTTVTFTSAGIYDLQLSADDSGLMSTDRTTVTVVQINQAPSVDAGPPQSVTLNSPATLTLNGLVSDDGLPNPPSVVSTLWSKVSGPGSVTFADDTAVSTTATFTVAGTYVLMLSADDSAQTSADQVTITVNQSNQPPIVDAGQDVSITLISLATATLNGSVSDDGMPNPPGVVSTLWEVVSGPGSVTFADGTEISTTATFNTAGTYVLRLTADDGNLSSSDDVTIVITQSSSNPNLVSNLAVASGEAYQVVDGGLTTGASIFIDRGYDITSLPVSVDGTTYIQTANRDKSRRDDSFLSFAVNQAVSVYVAYDSRASSLPNWLSSWNNTGNNIGTTDVRFNLFTRDFASGGVFLGANMAAGATGAGSNYFVAVVPSSSSTTPNQPPAVDAGTDATILLSSLATLNGSVSDDGLPNPPGVVSILWEVVSGPGSVTFADDTAVNTTATFTVAGTYVLMLSADDGDMSANSQVTITVDQPNQQPLVDAGGDQSVTLNSPATVTLNGSVSDDGLPNPPGVVSTLWEVVSGPGSVTFADDTAVNTTATFTVAGTYMLMLSADDGDMASTDNLTITVLQPNQTLSVSNLSVASGKAYQVVDDGLAVGARLFIDRSYEVKSVPGSVDGATYIQTANADKVSTDDSFLSFTVNQAVTVYVAYDSRATSLPNWLSSWSDTGAVIDTTDVRFNLFAMDFLSGDISLGGNRASGAAKANSNYFVAVTAQ